jgi:hypothetical protein
MSVKLKLPLPAPVLRPEPRPPVSPGFAKGEPVPSAPPSVRTDGFERASPGAQTSALGGSRFEKAGAVKALSPRQEKYKSLVDNLVDQIVADDKLREQLLNDDPKVRETIIRSLELQGVPPGFAKHLADNQILPQAKAVAGSSGSGTTRPIDAFSNLSPESKQSAADYFTPLLNDAKTFEDHQRILGATLENVKLADGESIESLKAFAALKLGESMTDKGITPRKLGPGADGFQGNANGGIVPDRLLEELPTKLEPHRDALEKLTDRLLRDPQMDNDARLRKTLWGELKKLPFQGNSLRREARQHLLEEISLRQDRYTE